MKKKFPYMKGQKVWIYIDTKGKCIRSEIVSVHPTKNGVRLKDLFYFSRDSVTMLDRVAPSKKEALFKKYLKESSNLEYRIRGIERSLKNVKDLDRTLSKIRTQIVRELRK